MSRSRNHADLKDSISSMISPKTPIEHKILLQIAFLVAVCIILIAMLSLLIFGPIELLVRSDRIYGVDGIPKAVFWLLYLGCHLSNLLCALEMLRDETKACNRRDEEQQVVELPRLGLSVRPSTPSDRTWRMAHRCARICALLFLRPRGGEELAQVGELKLGLWLH